MKVRINHQPSTISTKKVDNTIVTTAGEHYWELFPIPILPGTTHTLAEVIHSSNREHRHQLKSDCVPGYYSYLWTLIIPDDEEIPNDFDALYSYSDETLCSGLMRNGRTFNQKDLSLAIEKVLCFIQEIKGIWEVQESGLEVI